MRSVASAKAIIVLSSCAHLHSAWLLSPFKLSTYNSCGLNEDLRYSERWLLRITDYCRPSRRIRIKCLHILYIALMFFENIGNTRVGWDTHYLTLPWGFQSTTLYRFIFRYLS